MNKSLITNLLTLLVIGASFIENPFQIELRAIGLYAFSGAITNWLAIHMLFEKVPFLYGSGVITNRFEDFKIGIKGLVMTQFFTKENLEKFMSDETSSTVDYDLVFKKIKEAVLESQFGSMLNMFGGEAALEPLRPKVEEKMNEILKESTKGNTLVNDVSLIVEKRLDELTPKMVKDIIQEMIKVHLGWLVVWGGVFGGFIGYLSSLF